MQDSLGFIFWEEDESTEHVLVRLNAEGDKQTLICKNPERSYLVVAGTEDELGIWVGIQNPLDDLTL